MTAPTLPDDVRNRLRHVLLTISPLCPVDEQIDKFLFALSEAGYVVVPREPSEAMTLEGLKGLCEMIATLDGPRVKLPAPQEILEDGTALVDIPEEDAPRYYMQQGAIMRNGVEVNACYAAMIAASETP